MEYEFERTGLTINPNRISEHESYMQIAESRAKRSKANRTQVGAILVKDEQIISDGWNGMPRDSHDPVCEVMKPGFTWMDSRDDDGNLKLDTLETKPQVIHAEHNAVLKAARNGGMGTLGADLYVTMSPCVQCAGMLAQAGIKRVFYRDAYRDSGGLTELEARGIECQQVKRS